MATAESSAIELVLLPGLDGSALLFERLRYRLGNLPHRTVTYPATATDYTELIRYVDERLPAKSNLVLLGESFGGPIAIALAARRRAQVRGLILCASFARAPRSGMRWLTHMASWPLRPPSWLGGGALMGRYWTVSLQREVTQALSALPTATLWGRLGQATRCNMLAELSAITAPLVYLRASEDLLVPPNAIRSIRAAQPTVEEIRVAGPHLLLQSNPVACADIIHRFIAQIESQTRQAPC
ncbi:MAG TPA: alpha/beta fold hydrolase [Chitinolyticbacter sp.]|nr:alpha/beta fold hydrolase [Chitinolyticbacter sp.]